MRNIGNNFGKKTRKKVKSKVLLEKADLYMQKPIKVSQPIETNKSKH